MTNERQPVCYPRSGTCSLKSSVCCVLITFSSSNFLSNSPNHDQNMTCCSPLKGLVFTSDAANFPFVIGRLHLQYIYSEKNVNGTVQVGGVAVVYRTRMLAVTGSKHGLQYIYIVKRM